MAKRRAFCVGINDYPYDGSDLKGCVNDAHEWAGVLRQTYGFDDITIVLDADATKKRIIDGLKDLLAGAAAGDALVFTNSSHGSYKADTSGDEAYDQVLCPYDVGDNEIVDDELRSLFENAPEGVRLTVVLDNCFSGTGTRVGDEVRAFDDRRVRFLDPAVRGGRQLQRPSSAHRKGELHPESAMKEVLLTGCNDRQYAYDAAFNGTYHGAMTYFALQAIREAPHELTYNRLHKRIKELIADYPQSPQLEGRAEGKRRALFI